MSWAIAAPILGSLGGAALSSKLNKPSGAQKAAQRAQGQAAEAEAADIRRATALKKELEALIKGMSPLSGDAKNALIQRGPGKQTDFSGVRGTGDIDLLMQLAGLGSSSSTLNQAAGAANQQDIFGQQQTGETVENLVALLLGLGGGGGGGGGYRGLDASYGGMGSFNANNGLS